MTILIDEVYVSNRYLLLPPQQLTLMALGVVGGDELLMGDKQAAMTQSDASADSCPGRRGLGVTINHS